MSEISKELIDDDKFFREVVLPLLRTIGGEITQAMAEKVDREILGHKGTHNE